MKKTYCDICEQEIKFPRLDDEPREIKFADGESVWIIKMELSRYNQEGYWTPLRIPELCDKCFNDILDNAYAKHRDEITELRAQKAKGFSVPVV